MKNLCSIFLGMLALCTVGSTAFAGDVNLTPGGRYDANDGTVVTCSGATTPDGAIMAVQGYDFGPDHPNSAINVLKRSCDGTLSQTQCRKIEENQFKDTMCFGICHLNSQQ